VSTFLCNKWKDAGPPPSESSHYRSLVNVALRQHFAEMNGQSVFPYAVQREKESSLKSNTYSAKLMREPIGGSIHPAP